MNHLSIKYQFCTGEHGVACVKSEVKYCSLTKIVIGALTYEQSNS